MKQKLTELKEKTDNSTVLIRDFKIPLPTWVEYLDKRATKKLKT